MKKLLFCLLATATCLLATATTTATHYAHGDVITFNKATRGKGVNVVIVGEGFNHNDLRKGGFYETKAQELADLFLNLPVYRDLKAYLNVYALCVESKDSGVDVLENNVPVVAHDTYFNMPTYSGPGSEVFEEIKRLVGDMKEISDITETPVIMINNGQVGGFCWPEGNGFAIGVYSTVDNHTPYWVAHEFGGHAFGRLADEYDYCSDPPASADDNFRKMVRTDHAKGQDKNSDVTNDPAQVQWAAFIGRPGYEMVGLYEGAHYMCKGVWRPEATSVMRDHGSMRYNAPSRYYIWQRIMKTAGESDNIESFFEYDKINLTND
jgi:hypothetical protein